MAWIIAKCLPHKANDYCVYKVLDQSNGRWISKRFRMTDEQQALVDSFQEQRRQERSISQIIKEIRLKESTEDFQKELERVCIELERSKPIA